MHNLSNTASQTSVSNLFRQCHMHMLKSRLVTVKNCHQVDECIVPGHRARQSCFVMRVKLQHSQARQMLDRIRIGPSPRWHGHLPALTHQFFTHMGTDEAGTA